MSSKLNVIPMVPEFVATLYDASDPDRRIRRVDVAVLYGVPVAGGLASYLLGHNPGMAMGILTLFVVVSGFLLNVSMQSFNWIIAEHHRKADEKVEERTTAELRVRLMTEVHQGVAYGLVIGLLGLGLALPVALTSEANPGRWRAVAFAACVALGIHLGFILLIVAKRMTRIALHPPRAEPSADRDDLPGVRPVTQLRDSAGDG